MEPIKPDFTIVYEKYTEEAANFISGSLANKYTCNTLKDTIFEGKKNTYSNNNRILFLSDKLIDQYLSMAKSTLYEVDVDWGGKYKFTVFTYLYSLGNWRGIWVNIEKSFKTGPKSYYWHGKFVQSIDFLFSPFLGGRRFKMVIDNNFYKEAAKYFLKEENIKLLIPD